MTPEMKRIAVRLEEGLEEPMLSTRFGLLAGLPIRFLILEVEFKEFPSGRSDFLATFLAITQNIGEDIGLRDINHVCTGSTPRAPM